MVWPGKPSGHRNVGKVVANLVAPVRFGFDRLFASDIQGRARAFKSLVDGSMDKVAAARMTGLTNN